MSFEFGSETLDLKNPFRLEGLLSLVRGIITIGLAAYILYDIRLDLNPGRGMLPWVSFAGALIILAMGLGALLTGLNRSFRFYVGRGVPIDLTERIKARGADGDEVPSNFLVRMLESRSNLYFTLPGSFFARMLHSLFPRLIFLPAPYRHTALRYAALALKGIVIIGFLFVALFLVRTGIAPLKNPVYTDWLFALTALALLLLVIGFRPLGPEFESAETRFSAVSQVAFLALLVFISPILGPFLERSGSFVPPEVPVAPAAWVLWPSLGVIALGLMAVLLASLRARIGEPRTEVSEFRDHWDENIHPSVAFQFFDSALADMRHLEIPNRKYIDARPQLNEEGSQSKGSFAGRAMQETQPVPAPEVISTPLHALRLTTLAGGHAIMLMAAFWLANVVHPAVSLKPAVLVPGIVAPLIMWRIGALFRALGTLYFAEIPFTSTLTYLKAEGAYSESKISVGNAIQGNIQSENRVVRSTLSPWILLSRITSTTFATSGPGNLSNPRYVVDMEKDDSLLQNLIDRVRGLIDDRHVVADLSSPGDYTTALKFDQVNDVLAGNRPAPTADVENAAVARITQDQKNEEGGA